MSSPSPTYTGVQSGLVQPSGQALTDAVIVGSKWGHEPIGTAVAVTFAFPRSREAFDQRADVPGAYHADEPTQGGFAAYLAGFVPFDETAANAAREVLRAWSQVAQLDFVEVPADRVDAGALRFALTRPPSLGATTYGVSAFPQDLPAAGDTWMNAAFLYPEGWAAGTQNFLTLLHEVGHALGLKHPHDTGMDGTPGWPATPSLLDKIDADTLKAYSTQDLVMAYNDLPGVGAPVQADYAPTTPMRVDIAAIQYLYGANRATESGDTSYTFHSDQRYNQTLWDAGGIDTIRVEGSADALISLVPGTWSQLGLPLTYSERNADLTVARPRPDLTDARTVYLYDTVAIENATGGSGNDRLIGNALDNVLRGGAGNDRIDGGGGLDQAVFAGARAAYTLLPVANGWSVEGPDGKDALAAVERLRFDDLSLALDIGVGERGQQAAQIVRGLFGAAALADAAVVGQGLAMLDQGMAYGDVIRTLLAGSSFVALAGSPSNFDFVRVVYRNVVGVAPGEADLQHFAGLIENGTFTQASLAMLACQHPLNTGSVELTGLAQTGLAYLPAPGGL